MCAGALLQGRVDRLVYGARNDLLGAHGSWIDILSADESQIRGDDLQVVPAEYGAGAEGLHGSIGAAPNKVFYRHPFHRTLQVQHP